MSLEKIICFGAVLGVALADGLNPIGQRAEAIPILDNTPPPQGSNPFSAPANPNDGQTNILSRGYAFSVGNSDYTIDSVSAYLTDWLGTAFNTIVPTARLEMRSFDGTAPGQLLESLMIQIANENSNTLSMYAVPSWKLAANTAYWLGLNWVSPYNQGNSNINNPFDSATWALFGWSVSSPSLPVMASDFADLGFHQYVVGPFEPNGGWQKVPYAIQSNSLRVNATPVPAPLPLVGVAVALRCSRKLRKHLRRRKSSVALPID